MADRSTAQSGVSSDVRDALGVISDLDSALARVVRGLDSLFPSATRQPETVPMMQQLAPGLEALLKLTYVEAVRHATGQRPSWKQIRGYSHNLLRVLDDLIGVVAHATEYARRPAVQDDLRFMGEDDGLRAMLRILSGFGEGGRYAGLNGLLDPAMADPDLDPARQWDEMELDLLRLRPDWPVILESAELEAASSFEVASRLQRFARAIARMWTLGALGERGPQHCGALGPILYVMDDELGIRRPKP